MSRQNQSRTEPADAPADAPVNAPVVSPEGSPVDVAPPSPPVPPAAAPAGGSRKKLVFAGIALIAALAAGYEGWSWWTNGRFMVTTDDAYIQADLSLISSKITGYVSEIAVTANQHVKMGDVLFRIDDGDYRISLEQSQAKLTELTATLSRIDAQVLAAEANVTQAEAQLTATEAVLTAAHANTARIRDLAARRVSSQADLDNANQALATAEANRTAAAAAIAGAKAQVGVLEAQRSEAASTRRELELASALIARDLDFTVMRAPFDGTVANIAIKQGELVSAGARLAAVVPDHGLFVEANLKETQLAEIRAGQRAMVSVDALDGQEVEGRVISLSPATGSVFSLLPANNATGNFTKIVQRVPVRIELPEGVAGLRAGLSVEVSIDTRTGEEAATSSSAGSQPAGAE
ncbi:HlyD family secretion protein [Xinfangfangia sp. D13-10-4-6]|uniref:HlyD family secretion protein n=1 Tax=Pseudogemmobacter hezensis TaxID=2737662 RepID=UPI001553B390|nr:HlyD family secretion protein [Pseudogemmobacter hezensis]NPD15533.1 HlyD family secretion protein [Pseudogemmobacter hezensis]